MTDKTLSDHCREYYQEKGIKYPTVDTDLNKLLYEAWAEWAFSNLRGTKNV